MEYDDEEYPTELVTQNVFRILSALNKRLDELTTFVEKSEKHDARSDEMLLDMIDKMKSETEDDEVYEQFLNMEQTQL